MYKSVLAAGLGLLTALSAAAPHSPKAIGKRCTFDSATSPECWGDYDLSTNWYEDGPDTGVVREYWFDITNTTMAPDGVERMVLSVNGTVPGPTIFADWGDTVVVHVRNSMENNGTSIHFHGIRQNYTSDQDGVASITQCPTAPGDVYTYRWKATQYGSTWYHSHFSLQAWNGVFGGIVINGPASAPYDEDLGILPISDWFHRTVDELYAVASTSAPPSGNNGLLNGTNVYQDGGSRYATTFEAGKSYRLRLVNTAIDTMYRFSIDNHTLTVIANDLVPIHPYSTTTLNIGIGQRYDVIVTADQAVGDYWLRAIPQTTCSSADNVFDIKGIVRYDASSTADPSTIMYSYEDSCNDEDAANLVPYLALEAGDGEITSTYQVGLNVVDGWFKWTLNSNTFLSDWAYPTLEQALQGNASWVPEQQVLQLNQTNEWVYFIIENTGLTHPIHLHGHDFWVLSQGSGSYSTSTVLNTANTPRRDVAMLPANGHLVIAFKTDNPGVWLMHCHIGWHTSQGFALQLVERADEIAGTISSSSSMADTCSNWAAYANRAELVQEDSGV
ncbi:multicopper oxidase [Thozetella sp. PMI_491]|nr:multicopper oxidase [Thozetella sp. PMI_491]